MMNDPADVIVSPRIADRAIALAPATRSSCGWCGAEIWLGLQIRRDLPLALVICEPCAHSYAAANPDDVNVIAPDERRGFLARRQADA